MFEENQTVTLKNDLPDAGLKAGAHGIVVYVYPETPPAYEVDFVDTEGITIALLTVKGQDLAAA